MDWSVDGDARDPPNDRRRRCSSAQRQWWRRTGSGGHLFAFDLKTKQRTQLTTDAVGGIDGIEPDGRGGPVVTRDVIGAQTPARRQRESESRAGERSPVGEPTSATSDRSGLAVVPFLHANNVFGGRPDRLR